uniref:Nonstructural protein 2 n=1 Tax=Grus japonensis parvoviridae sp. TaxID=2794512 RepID=A0A8A4XDN9_9VIRU|nr:MAG: nonstructural protein 2 [Grus japonensis parvoviridae sp.]
MKAWDSNYKKWSVDGPEQLIAKSSILLKGTYQTSLSSTMMASVVDCLNGLANADPVSLEDCLSMSMKEIISTSSTIVPIQETPADANSRKRQTFDDQFETLCDGYDSSTTSTKSTGRMLSYTSLCRNGKADRKFGLEEDYKDYRLTLKLYDGQICRSNPDQYWTGKLREMDVTISQDSPIMKKIESVFLEAHQNLKRKGANLRESPKRFKHY